MKCAVILNILQLVNFSFCLTPLDQDAELAAPAERKVACRTTESGSGMLTKEQCINALLKMYDPEGEGEIYVQGGPRGVKTFESGRCRFRASYFPETSDTRQGGGIADKELQMIGTMLLDACGAKDAQKSYQGYIIAGERGDIKLTVDKLARPSSLASDGLQDGNSTLAFPNATAIEKL